MTAPERNQKYRQKHKVRVKEAKRTYYQEHKEARGEYQRNYRRRNKEKVLAARKIYYREHKERLQSDNLFRNYGLSLTGWKILSEGQNNKCKICGQKTKLVVDHDHKTKIIRGLVCNSCNILLGMSHDNPAILMQAAKYLTGKFDESR
jgi:hypothetical protein